METKRVRNASLLLILLSALAPASFALTGGRGPGRLYQVYRSEARRGPRFGFIDKTGRLVIGFDRLPNETETVGEFHEGLALFVLKSRGDQAFEPRVGYVDETGAVVISARFAYGQ